MRVAVVGSGPSGMACAKALIRRGLTPTVLDVGEVLPARRRAAVERMAAVAPDGWAAADRALVTENPTLVGPGVPKKTVFGSDFYFAKDRPFSQVSADAGIPYPTFAQGGYSTAWGAALLPADRADLADWPSEATELEPSYRNVLRDMPLMAEQDGLAQAFPLFKDDPTPGPLPRNVGDFLNDLDRAALADPGRGTVCGRSRLAISLPDCRLCGLCLSGCVYGAIFSTGAEIARLDRLGDLRYRSNSFVRHVREAAGKAIVTVMDASSGEDREEEYDRVFVAAGAIQSTRMVLESLSLFDQPRWLMDSQKFVVPLLRVRSAPMAWPSSLTLANLFLDYKTPQLSDHWVHVQISAPHDYLLRRLRLDPWTDGLKRRIVKPLYERLYVGWGGLHSDHSSKIELTLGKADASESRVLRLKAQVNPAADGAVKAAVRRLGSIGRRAGALALTPALAIGATGSGNHFGGSMPMRASQRQRLDTDSLGRLADWRSIHIVDGAVLPSIPATTLALLQMANADRIATHAPLD